MEELAELVKHLPLKLQAGISVQVLERAIEERVIAITPAGRLEWKLESKTLLAHFCGRMWCGDTLTFNKRVRQYKWKFGAGRFPGKDLEELFGVGGLRDLRRKREFRTPPAGFELILKIFQ